MAAIVVVDFCFGFGARYIQAHAKGGATARNQYINKKMHADMVFFGSSRCVHHYVPKIFEDSLHVSCYNAGSEGNGIISQFARLKMMLSRYTPKIIVYDVNANFDLLVGDNTKYLSDLRTYCDEPGVDSVIYSVDSNEQYKLKSMMYRYNSIWLQILSDNIYPLSSNKKGFVGLNKKMKKYKPAMRKKASTPQYDSLKIHYLEEFIRVCRKNNIILVFSLSPMYLSEDETVFDPVKTLCRQNDIPLLDHYSDRQFVSRQNYFSDSVHMNEVGAYAFSKVLVSEINLLLKLRFFSDYK